MSSALAVADRILLSWYLFQFTGTENCAPSSLTSVFVCRATRAFSSKTSYLFTVLTSAEMVAVTRLLAIMHITICMPLRFLMGKTHEWAEEFDWGVVELGETLDCWYDAMVHIKTRRIRNLQEPNKKLLNMKLFNC
jgi:uncharacterized membrane protein